MMLIPPYGDDNNKLLKHWYCIEKGAFKSPSTMIANLLTKIYIYIYILEKISRKKMNQNTDSGFKNDISSLFQKDFIVSEIKTKYHFWICCQCFGLSTFPLIFSYLVGVTKSTFYPHKHIYIYIYNLPLMDT